MSDQGVEPETARQVFGRRVDRYAELDVFSDEQFYRPLLDLADPGSGDHALDLATGTGLLALMVARKATRVVGVDVTPEMLEKARERIATGAPDNIEFLEAPVSELPFPDGSFDLVTCRLAFHHFPDPAEALAQISRVLKPGGRFVMEDVFGPDDAAIRVKRERLEKLFDPSHVRAWSPAQLRALLQKAGFRISGELEPYNRGMPVDFILKLERIEDPVDRAKIINLLRENLDVDLGGFRAIEVDGELVLRWKTVIFSARKT
ncbi:MAG: methyltransferase domain-containing protein [Thermoleophilia bacterium]